ncbi:MAG TPA: SDR family oxidoreductase [Mycobacteriales bacterium]|nr:SDR family oxidoreductase [Mycobacteriales bacterium]
MTLAGRVVAVTGAARGIGLAVAEALVERSAVVALGDLDADAAVAAAERLGPLAHGFAVDVTDTASFRAFLDGVEDRVGRPVDVLVNNAGVMWVGRYDDEPEAVALRQADVNLHGVARGMKLALPRMRARGRGHVVNIASFASRVPPAGEAMYSATKHAVLGYSTAVRAELRGTGVHLSVVMPVVVDTELAVGTGTGGGVMLQPRDVADAVVDVLQRPRFEVFVPRWTGLLARLYGVAPQGVRDAMYRLLMPDNVRDGDLPARREYERRAVGA